MKLTVPPLTLSEDDGFKPHIDIFGRVGFGESLYGLIKNTDDELVVAIDAPWGEGKSTFIKMWRGYLKENGIASIYFDAFENDYINDPMLAISSQLYRMIDKNDTKSLKEFKNKATGLLRVVGRAGLRVGIKALTAGVLDETILEETGNIRDASDEASKLVDNYLSDLIARADEDREKLEGFKRYLTSLGEKLGQGSPAIFIMDELDRCKPHYALSIIETIKHFFSVKNMVFVLVINRQQIEESVRHEYGEYVDAAKYLQKFVTIWTTLPKPTEDHNSVPKKYIANCLERMGYQPKARIESDAVTIFEELATHYDLSLREIEKSLTNFAIIYNSTSGNMSLDYYWIAVFVSVIKTIKPDIYRRLSKNSILYGELVDKASLRDLKEEWWNDKPEGHYLKWLLRYFLSSDEEASALLSSGNHLSGRYAYREKSISTMCSYLDLFKQN